MPLPQVEIGYNPTLTQRIKEIIPDVFLDTHLEIPFDSIALWENGESIPSAQELIRLYFFCCQHYDFSDGWVHLPFWIMGDGVIEVPLNTDYCGVQKLGKKDVNMKKMRYNSKAIEDLRRKVYHITNRAAHTFIGVSFDKMKGWQIETSVPDAHKLGYIYQLYREHFNLFSESDFPLEAPLGLHYDVPINFILRRNET